MNPLETLVRAERIGSDEEARHLAHLFAKFDAVARKSGGQLTFEHTLPGTIGTCGNRTEWNAAIHFRGTGTVIPFVLTLNPGPHRGFVLRVLPGKEDPNEATILGWIQRVAASDTKFARTVWEQVRVYPDAEILAAVS